MAVQNEVRVLPRASGRGSALFSRLTAELVQRLLLAGGALLLPLGLIVICLGWYGAAHTPYEYDQTVYLLSGGALGLGLTFVGGFVYFGSWLARMSANQQESQRRLEETLVLLAQLMAKQSGPVTDTGAELVVAGDGTTLHRRDCELLTGRTDLRPAPSESGLVPCRLCRP